MLAVAVDKDELGLDGAGGLEGVLTVGLRGRSRWLGIYRPCFGVQLDAVEVELALTVGGHGDGWAVSPWEVMEQGLEDGEPLRAALDTGDDTSGGGYATALNRLTMLCPDMWIEGKSDS